MKSQVNRVILLLGSNIQPETNLPQAIQLLAERFPISGVSSVWETPAIGSDGPKFLNAAVLIESFLTPQTMKTFVLRPLEASLGRIRTSDKNASRTIDLDVAVWDEQTWDQDIWHYAHAAIPVAELMSELRQENTGDNLAQVARNFRSQTEINLQLEITQEIHSLLDSFSPNPVFKTNRSTDWIQPSSR